MQEHVRVLLLGRPGPVALRIGVRGDVERVALQNQADVGLDVLREAGVDLRQHVPAVMERPHLADGLVAHPGDDPADLFENRVDGPALCPPVVLGQGQGVADGVPLAVPLDRHHVPRRRIVLHVVDSRADVHERLEHRVGSDVLDPDTVHVDLAAVPQRRAILLAGSDHLHPPRGRTDWRWWSSTASCRGPTGARLYGIGPHGSAPGRYLRERSSGVRAGRERRKGITGGRRRTRRRARIAA